MSNAKRKFWGWGNADEALSAEERTAVEARAHRLAGGDIVAVQPPRLDEFSLRQPRITPPASLARLITHDPYERLLHAYGKSFPDSVRMFMRACPNPPDLVAYPENEEDITALLDWAANNRVAVIPFGGGSSVCGGVEPDVGDAYAGTLTIDMRKMNACLEIDRTSRAAHFEGGIFGPALEDTLRPHNLTLRHFPQSFAHSTLGGWIATRSGGHYATLMTHIDDFVESVRVATPAGMMETRRLPGSGAGPSPDRMFIGSEGTLGIITEAWMRLQDRPVHRASTPVLFPDMQKAVAAVRALAQSGLYPSNCRLLDPLEAKNNGVGDGAHALLVLGFESADHPVEAWAARALELARDYGGLYDATPDKNTTSAAGAWRNAFLRMPYAREVMTGLGIISDTFETAITWDRFDDLYEGARAKVSEVIRRATGHDALVSCRFTHIYPDGPAPYFSFGASGARDGNLAPLLDQWREIKEAANEAVIAYGGTITHHHAVGRDHRAGYDAQAPALYRRALAGAKAALDPALCLNPGVLIGNTPGGIMHGDIN